MRTHRALPGTRSSGVKGRPANQHPSMGSHRRASGGPRALSVGALPWILEHGLRARALCGKPPPNRAPPPPALNAAAGLSKRAVERALWGR